MIRTPCTCPLCNRPAPIVPLERTHTAADGPFGARAPGSRSRYREHMPEDLYTGRRAGGGPTGWPAPVVLQMPRPDFVEAAEASRVVRQVEALVSEERSPRLRRDLAAVSDARRDLVASTLHEYFVTSFRGPGDVRRAFERAKTAYQRIVRRSVLFLPADSL